MPQLSKTKKNKIIKDLEALVGLRLNKKKLESRLTEIFGTKTKVSNISKKDDELTDYNYMGEMKNEPIGLFGYFDIYFLKHRTVGFDGATFMVTEVAYEFE